MGLYQRPDSDVYWISYNGSDGRRVRESTRTTDKEAAKRLLKDREGRAARGEVLLRASIGVRMTRPVPTS
jgi:hypothetical protein